MRRYKPANKEINLTDQEDKPSKYKNKKVIVDGMKFDSEIEYRFWLHLTSIYPENEIERQPVYELLPKFNRKSKIFRSIKYIADFRVGNIVYDVKGMITPDFAIKYKLFHYVFEDLKLKLMTECPKKFRALNGGDEWIETDNLRIFRKNGKTKKGK